MPARATLRGNPAWVPASPEVFHKASLSWTPRGWWSTLWLPDFPRRQWITHNGDYLSWRRSKWRNRILYELGHTDVRKKKTKSTNKTQWREKKGKSQVRSNRMAMALLRGPSTFPQP